MNKLLTVSLAAAILFLLPVTARSQQACRRHVETEGGFSMCVPVGWEVRAREGEKYKMIFGTPNEHFVPNMNFKDETNSRLLNDYVTAAIDYLLAHYKEAGADSVKVVNRERFTTNSGVAGVRITLRSEFKGLLVRSLQYYFDGTDNQKIIITATALEVNQSTLDPIFEQAAKSFRLEK